MKEEKINPDGLNIGHATPTEGAESITALKEEVARLTEENKSLTAKLQKTEYDLKIFKSLWSDADKKETAMIAVMKELVALAKLG